MRAARAAFTTTEGTVALEHVAREAGVGIGTLYRHFPTREDLIEAVYSAELDEVVDSATTLAGSSPPEEALRAWLERYAAFIATKHGMAETLRAGMAAGRITPPTTRQRITAAVGAILTRGAETGTLRPDVDPEDVVVMALGAFATSADDPARTGRLITLILDALRPTTPKNTPRPSGDAPRPSGTANTLSPTTPLNVPQPLDVPQPTAKAPRPTGTTTAG